ncbi:integrase [Rhizobium leguminosarum]|uniref:tyrosine-type recombinase/integrase n=1 Tax=Rhizobium leguminosarum TaxID=384 RepID=UPI00160BBE11|nr:site-specific integrase [Rhizobium leguminosarum]MBB4585582.1 integrase [Rhizobium leguminosarum]
MPLLLPIATGVPMEAPTFWIVGNRRALGWQPNTLFNELRSLMFLYLWAELRQVDVEERLREGTFFSLGEIIDLVNVCGRFLDDVLEELEFRSSNIVKLSSKRPEPKAVNAGEKRNRLSVIRSFLEFTSADHLSQLQQWPPRYIFYQQVREQCLKHLGEHISGIPRQNRDDIDLPEGLDPDVIKRLRAVIEPDHPENPFEPNVRFRNYVMIRLLLELGIRRGELLGIYVVDCVLGGKQGSVTIHRRPDDPNDPRREKPATKTRARVLELNGRLTELVHEWIIHYRAKIPDARKTPFLIVASDGSPMSVSNINKMFISLRERVPGLPKEVAPHRLRHSWNDAFSELADRKGISAEDEIKWRMRIMGWRREESAQHYQRRTVKRRSNEVLREMQDELEIRLDNEGNNA